LGQAALVEDQAVQGLVLLVIQRVAEAEAVLEYLILMPAMGAVQLAAMAVEQVVAVVVAVVAVEVTAAVAKVECLVPMDELVLEAQVAIPHLLGLFAAAAAAAATVAVGLLGQTVEATVVIVLMGAVVVPLPTTAEAEAAQVGRRVTTLELAERVIVAP
jgi:hypothetical protein